VKYSLKPIIRKITITGENFSVFFIEDETEYAEDLIEAGCNGFDEKNIYEYFKEGKFTDKDVDALNGKHFLFGFLEALYQSERCPDILYTCTCPLTYTIEKVEAGNKKETVFFITVFQRIEENLIENEMERKISPYLFGCTETVGCFHSIERCREILKDNMCDIYDNAGFEYAIIEEYEFDTIYPVKISTELYKARHFTVDTPVPDGNKGILKTILKHEVTYEKVELSKDDKIYQYLKDQPFALY
jgi:hypothetical protein